jgi:V8-like Glu-specific endopeptidase
MNATQIKEELLLKQHKKLIATLLILALVVTLCFSYAFASTGSASKTISYRNIKITLNGLTITPTDANGNAVEPFIMDGSTYLPVRAVANALGLNVGWDSKTSTVSLNSNAELTPTELYKQYSPSVVHIETNTGGGTGFFIEEDIVATNNHVIKGAWHATIKTVDGQVYDVIEVVAASENPDLALLRVDGKGTPVTLNTQTAEMGSTIFSIGAPLGIFPTMNTGIIANNRHTENGTSFYLSNIPFLMGNSGGPIFNAKGEVIGVVVGNLLDGENSLGWIIKASYLTEMDRSNPFELTPPPPDEENYTKASSLKDAEVGQLVSFGHYEQDDDPSTTNEDILWIVVDKNGSELKLMSLYCLDSAPFMSNDDPVQWSNSYVRQFLNNDFFNRAFSASEQTMIKSVTVKNAPNPLHGTSSGEDTVDKVYLPSLEEAMEYYGIENCIEGGYEGVYAQATPYAINHSISTERSGIWLEIPGSTNCWWWLRSSGGNDQNATEIGSGGYLSFNGADATEHHRGLRPIIHINVK